MQDQFAPFTWYLQSDTGPYWMPDPLRGVSTRPVQGVASPPEIPSGGILGALGARPSGPGGGLLGFPMQTGSDPSLNPWTATQGAAAWLPSLPSSLASPPQVDQVSQLSPTQFQFDRESEPIPTARKKIDQAECDQMHQRDLFHCRMVGLPACYAQAYLRYSNCQEGRQIPPLNY